MFQKQQTIRLKVFFYFNLGDFFVDTRNSREIFLCNDYVYAKLRKILMQFYSNISMECYKR